MKTAKSKNATKPACDDSFYSLLEFSVEERTQELLSSKNIIKYETAEESKDSKEESWTICVDWTHSLANITLQIENERILHLGDW